MATALERHQAAQAARRARRLRVLSLADRAGVRPTMGGIARASGLNTSTVIAALDRTRRSTPGTIATLAKVLGLSSGGLMAVLEDAQ